jgi:peptidyl-dipeptidase A
MLRTALVALVVTSISCHTPPPPATAAPRSSAAEEFVRRISRELRQLYSVRGLALWDQQTNITEATSAAAARATEAVLTYRTSILPRAQKLLAEDTSLAAATRRQLKLLVVSGGAAPKDPSGAAELATLSTRLSSLYGEGKACDPGGCKDLGQLSDILADSRNPDELLAAWAGWHQVGRTIAAPYRRFVELANQGAQAAGFANVGEQWLARYDMPAAAMVGEADRLWLQVRPLYEQLHCFTRRKLQTRYGASLVPSGKPMPAHLLGNMWAQDWTHIYDLLEPYPGQPSPDATAALVARKYDATALARLAESFFTSLGLPALPATFWQRSMLTQPEGRNVVCHASAWDPTASGDVRIKMCTKINHEDLVTLHHELGHDYYFLHYFQMPILFQEGANDGFHEAIGDTVALSITPGYLKKVGLLDEVAANPEAEINRQLFVALDKIAFLPFGLLVDKWRWEVFSGAVSPEHYNSRWWELRRSYQGVVPPLERSSDDFDPGAKYHVPANTSYLRYFLSTILQFQFHRALCKEAGFKGALHECSIHGNRAAGKRLAAMLSLGASRPWPDALEALTGERTMDASAILDYFAPLQTWLADQNRGQRCGW